MKKRSKKLLGFTLLELVIVLAIFSMVTVGALAMVRPAMKLHNRTAAQERAVAAVDTMARFIQDNLRYADKMLVFKNHGIKDDSVPGKKGIDIIQDYPFGFENFNDKIDFISQKREKYKLLTSGEEIEVLRGEKDYYCYVNPVSAFLQYYLEESPIHDSTKSQAEKENYFNSYFKDKVIYVMEIKNTGEVNIYSYPLGGYNDLSIPLIMGVMYYDETTRPCSTISSSLSEGEEKVNIEKIEIGDDPSEGLNVSLSIDYKGTTTTLKLNYDMAVNFMNISSAGDTLYVNDNYPYNAKRYMVFDWGDKDRVVSERVDESSCYAPSKEERAIAGNEGYTYIVYSLPEIIP